MSHTVTNKYLKDMISVINNHFQRPIFKMLKNVHNTTAPCLHIIIFIETKCQVQSSIDQITSIHLV